MPDTFKLLGCMVSGCGRIATCRGMCSTHYSYYAKQVASGKTTWDKLVEEGYCKPGVSLKDRKKRFQGAFENRVGQREKN